MILYANGCSMTYGAELIDNPVTKKCLDHEHRLKTAWPGQLSKLLGMECVNWAKAAASNEKILRTSLKWISEYLGSGKDPSELFVVIGWTNVHRIEIRHNKEWRNVLPSSNSSIPEIREISRFFGEKIVNEFQDTIRFVNQIILFQSFLESKRIPYLFSSSLAIDIDQEKYKKYLEPQLPLINRERYFRLDNYCFATFLTDNSYPIAERFHPLEEGHKEWANILHQYIIENNLLSY